MVAVLALRAAEVEPLAAALEGFEQAIEMHVSSGAAARARREQISAAIKAHEAFDVVAAHGTQTARAQTEATC